MLRSMRRLVLASMLVLFACGGKATATSNAKGPAVGSTKSDADRPAAQPTPVNEDECKRMLDHVLELMVAEQRHNARAEHEAAQRERARQAAARGESAPAPVPFDEKTLWTEEDAAKIRESFVEENLPSCLAMPRESLDCALRAESAAQIREC